MSSEYQVHCSLCGLLEDVPGSNVEQLQAAKNSQVYICAGCQAKIRYESNQKFN